MDIAKVIAELRAYKAQIDEAITALEGLASRREKRRGRPPGMLSAVEAPRTRKFSAETRKRMALAQRKRWAAIKKTKAD